MNQNIILQIIPNADRFTKIDSIDKGYSHDKKYKVLDRLNNTYLLRLSDIQTLSHKKREFEQLNQLKDQNLNCMIPIEIGTTLDNNNVYTLSNWIHGNDTSDVLLNYSKLDQYEFGIDLGKLLKKIHTIQIEQAIISWSEFYNQKIQRKIDLMLKCPIELENKDHYLSLINNTKHYLDNQTITFQHGDFHIGNTLISNNEIYLIDFDRHDCGDPWEEFNRITFSVDKSYEFATGCIDGYFDFNVPSSFFPLLALYISVNQIASIPWAMHYSNDEIDTMKRLSRQILDWYDNFNIIIPKWYLIDMHKHYQRLQLEKSNN